MKANACILLVSVVLCVVFTVWIACAVFINCMRNAAKLHTFAFVFYGRQITGTVLGKVSRRNKGEITEKFERNYASLYLPAICTINRINTYLTDTLY
jgi:hypothetical protein